MPALTRYYTPPRPGYFEIIGSPTLTATVVQTGGNVYPDNYSGSGYSALGLTQGLTVFGDGVYDLEEGTITANAETVEGAGAFLQNGGINSVPGILGSYANTPSGLYVGYQGAGLATYTQDNGTLSANTEFIGYFTTGSFIQTGGTNNVTGTAHLYSNSINGLIVGASAGGNSYSLSGGVLSANVETIGFDGGSGTIIQTGGTNVISGNSPNGTLYLGDYPLNLPGPPSNGAYLLSGGNLQAGTECISDSGSGSFVQIGGTNVCGALLLSLDEAQGDYTLTNGTLNVSGRIGVLAPLGVPDTLRLQGGSATAGSVNNSGTILISSPTGSNTHGNLTVTGNFTQTGGTTLADGDLTIAAGSSLNLSGGTLSGAGSITGAVVNSGGTVSPGDGVGQLNLLGDYTQTSAGGLTINLAGEPATGEFGILSITGNADLDGTLDVDSLNGFIPTIGDTYTFLTADNVTGTFADVDSPYQLQLNYMPTGVSVTVLPEPAAFGGSRRSGVAPSAQTIIGPRQFCGAAILHGDKMSRRVGSSASGVTNQKIIRSRINSPNCLSLPYLHRDWNPIKPL